MYQPVYTTLAPAPLGNYAPQYTSVPAAYGAQYSGGGGAYYVRTDGSSSPVAASPTRAQGHTSIPTGYAGNTSIPGYGGSTSIPGTPTGAASIPYPMARQYETTSNVPGGLPGPGGDYVGELGRAAWKVLHATAEQYPPNPTYEEQQTALQFVYSFAKMYPCLKCRLHFQQLLKRLPPDVSSQPGFTRWMVNIHNLANADLGKPQWSP
jgi:hypothetical protein